MNSKIVLAGLFCIALSACGTSGPDASVSASNAPMSADDLLASPPSFQLATFRPASDAACHPVSAANWGLVGLQVEMMVTSLSCGNYYGKPDSYQNYRKLTAANADVFSSATSAVAEEMGGLAKFDKEQTRLSNVVSLSSVGFKQAEFCEPRRAWFDRIMSSTREDFINYSNVIGPAACGKTPANSIKTANKDVIQAMNQVSYKVQE